MRIKRIIKKFLPKIALNWYHFVLALVSKWLYGYPSNRMVVVGVTGTNGKSTVVNLIAKILNGAGLKTGWTSTVNFNDGSKQWLNNKKMTMLGRFQLQKLLKKMFKNGCSAVVVETSSEGIEQYRHLGINYDLVLITNLTPEHIESHGSFENYKKAKGKLFFHLSRSKKKKVSQIENLGVDLGLGEYLPKLSVVNMNCKHADYFLQFATERKYGFSLEQLGYDNKNNLDFIYRAEDISIGVSGSEFKLKGVGFKLKLLGKFNVENAVAAISASNALGIGLNVCRQALEKVDLIAGRMEFIPAKNFKVLVDYAPEVESLKSLYNFINSTLDIKGKVIHILGSCGGGRDKSRRSVLGGLAARNAEVIIVTNEDPYDENPTEIIDQVARGAEDLIETGCSKSRVYKILDRRQAIRKGLGLASDNDLVLITGKGSEQFMCVAEGCKVKWDDRKVVAEELERLGKK